MTATSYTFSVTGNRRATVSLTGLVGIGLPLVTWCKNG